MCKVCFSVLIKLSTITEASTKNAKKQDDRLTICWNKRAFDPSLQNGDSIAFFPSRTKQISFNSLK